MLPRAEANRVRAARIIVQHPRARALHAQLVRLMEQRARTVEAYASALEPHDDRALLASLQQQRRLQEDLAGLETSVLQARAAPPEYGCSVRRPGL